MEKTIMNEIKFLENNARISENRNKKNIEKDFAFEEYKNSNIYFQDLNKSNYYNVNNEEPPLKCNTCISHLINKEVEEFDTTNYEKTVEIQKKLLIF